MRPLHALLWVHSTVWSKQHLHKSVVSWISSRGRPNFRFGFGTETGRQLSLSVISFLVRCSMASFGFGQNWDWFWHELTETELTHWLYFALWKLWVCIFNFLILWTGILKGIWYIQKSATNSWRFHHTGLSGIWSNPWADHQIGQMCVCVHTCVLNCGYMWNKIILKLFQRFISHVTTSETGIKLFQLLNLFQYYFSDIELVGKYSWAAISFWNSFEIISGEFPHGQVSTRWNKIISVGCRRKLKQCWNNLSN